MFRRLIPLIALAACAVGWAQPILPPGTTVNAADYNYDMSPGALASIFGTDFTPSYEVATEFPLPTTLGGVTVEVTNGKQMENLPLFMVSPQQINVQLPYDLGTDLTVRVRTAAGDAQPYTFHLVERSPRIYTWTSEDSRYAIVTHAADGALATAERPVLPGDWITIWANSLGSVSPPLLAGMPANDGSEGKPLHYVTGDVRVFIGGLEAEIGFAGLAPNQAGLYQLNVRAPNFMADGLAEIRVVVDGVESERELMIPARSE